MSETSVTLRRMRWWDLDAVDAIEQQLFDQPWSTETFLSELAYVPESRHYLVAEQESQLLGYAGLRAVPPEADVQTLAVAPAAQGRGLGRLLLDALLTEAVRRGCTQVFLEVRSDNDPAAALYTARGFERIALRRGYYAPGQDAVIMRLRTSAEASA